MARKACAESKVTTICYGRKEEWASRKEAENYFLEAMLSSDGSEMDRYAKIYTELVIGQSVCTDRYDI